jgi:hypothetical protein
MKVKTWMMLALICFGLAACDQPERATGSLSPVPNPSQTWIDAPLPNSNIALLPYKIVFHGASFVGISEFELQVNGAVVAMVPPVSTSSGGSQYGTLFLGEYLWTPPALGTYLIAVRAKGNGQFSSLDQVQVTVGGDDVEEMAPLRSTPTASPTPSPTFTATIEEPVECTFRAITNLFCRLGPGKDYKDIDSFVPGQTAPIVGQSLDGYYWYVLGPISGRTCTVPADPRFGETTGDCENKPLFTPIPPTLTPTPTPTEQPLGCTVRQAGGAIICVSPCPAGASPGETCTP